MANTWTRRDVPRVPGELGMPIVDPANWVPDEILANDEWIYKLSLDEVAEVKVAIDTVIRDSIDIRNINQNKFHLPTLGSKLNEIQNELMDGRGLVLIQGLPIKEFSRTQFAIAFWGISSYLGTILSQNRQGHLLGHVKDLGGDYGKVRGYLTNAHMPFHCDQCDILGLACIHPAKKGGDHLVCSAVSLYNEMLKRNPDLVEELGWKFYRQLSTETHPGQNKPWIRQSTFNFYKGYFAVRSVSTPIYKAQALSGVPKLTPKQEKAFKVFHEIASELAIEVPLGPGDITYVMNHVTQHSRTEFVDWKEPRKKRHFLRLWLHNGRRPLPPEISEFSHGIYDETTSFVAPLEAE